MKLLLILCLFPAICFASSDDVDHVFIRAFQAAMATSLCSDMATIADDNSPSKEFETLIQLCKEKGDQSRAILDDYTNAKHI
ncbi:TPA: hypothetical protein ACF8KN_004494 [Salmonella enterica]